MVDIDIMELTPFVLILFKEMGMKYIIVFISVLVLHLQAAEIKDIKMTSMTFAIPSEKNTIVMQRNCQWCHSYGYILNQGKQPKAFWSRVVVKMRDTYKAPITQRDEKLIVEYLFKHFGNAKEK